MTEREWLTSEDPAAMLNFAHHWMDASNRKLRLFACACCRQVWHLLTDPRSRNAVEVAERYADGQMTDKDRSIAYHMTDVIGNQAQRLWARVCLRASASGGAMDVTSHLQRDGQIDLLRDIVGNPFRPVTLPHSRRCPAWEGEKDREECGCVCDWITPTVLTLARAAYEERGQREEVFHLAGVPCKRRTDTGTLDPLRLMVLADTLEEAGCPIRVEVEGPEELADSKEVCPYCSRWPANSPRGENGWVKCERWRSEVSGDDYGRCDKCNRLWKVGYDTVRVVTYHPHPLLTHLRSPGPHVRGCWAIDLLLGKE